MASPWLFVILLALCLAWLPDAAAQDKRLHYAVGASAAGAVGNPLPFWLAANRHGTLDARQGNVLSRLSISLPTRPGRRFDYALRADLLGRVSEHNTAHFPQLYGLLRYGPFELVAGRRARTDGLTGSTLSVGSMYFSGNATPVPQLSIALPDFTPVPRTNGFAAVKAYFSYGWFEADRFVSHARLHSKYLYVRLLPDSAPVQAYGGLIHNVVWGGTHPSIGPLPSSFRDFVRVVLARAGDPDSAPRGEVVNTLGNSLGGYEFALGFNTRGLRGMVHRLFFLETSPHGVGIYMRSPWDGMWGVHVRTRDRSRLVNGFLWEHVYTKRQGSKYSEGEPPGADDYYNNFLFKSGWTYYGRTLGLPLLFTDGDHLGVVNNIVIAHHFGLEGQLLPGLGYRTLFTYSRNYGARTNCNDNGCSGPTPLLTPRRDQASMLYEVQGALTPRLGFQAAVAVDLGEVYRDNVGVLFGLTWHGTLNTP